MPHIQLHVAVNAAHSTTLPRGFRLLSYRCVRWARSESVISWVGLGRIQELLCLAACMTRQWRDQGQGEGSWGRGATAPDAAGHGRKKAWPIIFTTNEQKSEYDEVCKMCQK